jgi:hypothetical protein
MIPAWNYVRGLCNSPLTLKSTTNQPEYRLVFYCLKENMRYPNLRYGNPLEFNYYTQGNLKAFSIYYDSRRSKQCLFVDCALARSVYCQMTGNARGRIAMQLADRPLIWVDIRRP